MLWILLAVLLAAWLLLRRRWRRQITQDEAILVTGCDSGFGLQIVKALLHETQALVFAGYITDEGNKQLQALGQRVVPLRMDVTKDAEVAECFETIKKSGKAFAGVVNNAGIGCYGWAEGITMECYERILNINLLGVIRVTKLALPLLRKSKGRLVNMGSMGGRVPSAFGSAYIPTKAALSSYQDCVRMEVYRFGVYCSLVEPGFFATGMLHRAASIGSENSTSQDSELARIYGETWSEKMKRSEDAVRATEKANGGESGVDYVTDAVLDALTAVVPKSRYLVGIDANVLGRIGPFIPSFVMDLLHTYIV